MSARALFPLRRTDADPGSVRSSFRKIRSGPADVAHDEWVGKVQAYSSDVEDIDWEQPRVLWNLFKENGDDEVFIQNLAGHLNKALPEVQKDTISKWSPGCWVVPLCPSATTDATCLHAEMFAKVDEEIGKRLDEAVDKLEENVDHKKAAATQTALPAHKK